MKIPKRFLLIFFGFSAALLGYLWINDQQLQLQEKRLQLDSITQILETKPAQQQLLLDYLSQHHIIDENSQQLLEQGLFSQEPTSNKVKTTKRIKKTESTANLESSVPTVQRTDIDLFICDRAKDNKAIKQQLVELANQFKKMPAHGRIRQREWNFYDEMALSELSGKMTIIFDQNHGEANIIPEIRQTLASVENTLPQQLIGNRGAPTEWMVSIVLCPEKETK